MAEPDANGDYSFEDLLNDAGVLSLAEFIRPGFARQARAAGQLVRDGVGHATVVMFGDSNTADAGTGASFYTNAFGLGLVGLMASTMLTIRGPKNHYLGAQNVNASVAFTTYDQSRWVFTGSAQIYAAQLAIGNDCIGFGAASGTITFTPETVFDRVEIVFNSTAAGPNCAIEVASVGVGNLRGDLNTGLTKVTIELAADASSFVFNCPASTDGLKIFSIKTWQSTVPAVLLMQGGWASATIANLTNTTNSWSPGNMWKQLLPDLVICNGCVLNDGVAATTDATWQASMRTLVTQIKSAGADVAWMTTLCADDHGSSAAILRLNQMARAECAANNIPMFDFESATRPLDRFFPAAIMKYDQIHPNDIGYRPMSAGATALLEACLGAFTPLG